jgi:hypothetical protein
MSEDIIQMALVQAIDIFLTLMLFWTVKSNPRYESLLFMKKVQLLMVTFTLSLILITASLLTLLT